MTSLVPQRASVICSPQDALDTEGSEHSLAPSLMPRGTLAEKGFSPPMPCSIHMALNH